jgi:hypothetical protein
MRRSAAKAVTEFTPLIFVRAKLGINKSLKAFSCLRAGCFPPLRNNYGVPREPSHLVLKEELDHEHRASKLTKRRIPNERNTKRCHCRSVVRAISEFTTGKDLDTPSRRSLLGAQADQDAGSIVDTTCPECGGGRIIGAIIGDWTGEQVTKTADDKDPNILCASCGFWRD